MRVPNLALFGYPWWLFALFLIGVQVLYGSDISGFQTERSRACKDYKIDTVLMLDGSKHMGEYDFQVGRILRSVPSGKISLQSRNVFVILTI